ncbi:zinc-dependent alcohol dehydrogenase family protein [Saccharopolyspora mangrovi]|uniref:Zinc-binding dehydrogenase n=1 Tax=Saccharopolyspora mangrovi TaxID=3082379 RepID=A0ABU6ALP3_9PSEU|nr:zinc-binding dehydrogenase [Saccharopolyspora sp. S2-29]MEB3372347.1 zinc-binding dehydrogenase [Saccharopolyspora sp. S2-29]
MKGAVFLGDRKVELREFPDPEPGPGEVIVQTRASGMCGSDLHVYRHQPGGPATQGDRIVGHEPAGVVCQVGQGVTPDVASVGDRVMIHHYIGCTRCDACRLGWPQMCTGAPFQAFGTQVHGGHAPLIKAPASTLVLLDPALSFEAGATIGCGTGTAWGALDRLGNVGGETLVVFGQGPVGLSATLLATARGARVIAVDPEPARRAHARRLGAAAVLDPTANDPVEALRDLTSGGAAFVLETSGNSAAITAGLQSLRPWGSICLVGLGGEVGFRVEDHFRSQITLMTSWTLSIVAQRRCAEFIATRELPVDDIFTHRWDLDDVVEAYANFDLQAGGKGVILFEQDA